MPIEILCSCGQPVSSESQLWVRELFCSRCNKPLQSPREPVSPPFTIETFLCQFDLLSFPDALSDNVILFGGDALWFGSLTPDAVASTTEHLIHGGDDANVTEPLTRVPYDSINQVECNLHDNFVSIQVGTEVALKRHLINLRDVRCRNHFLQLMTDTLGLGWENQVLFRSRLQAAELPGILLAMLSPILGLILWISTFPAMDLTNARPPAGARKLVIYLLVVLFNWIGWFWPACFVGTLLVTVLIWLAFRVVTPPIDWSLKRTPSNTDGGPAPDAADLATVRAPMDRQMESVTPDRNRSTDGVAWITRNRNRAAKEPLSSSPAATADQTGRSKRVPFLLWLIFAGLVSLGAFDLGRLIIWSNNVAWLVNSAALYIHVVACWCLLNVQLRSIWKPTITLINELPPNRMLAIVAGLVLACFSSLSTYVLMIVPSDHPVSAAFASGFSVMGALWEAHAGWKRFRDR